MNTVKYIRTSTEKQNTARQETDSYKCYTDKCSGRIPFADRPAGKELLRDAKAGKVSNVIITSIDRLGRNTKDILATIDLFTELGICVESEAEGLKTCDKKGKLTPIAQLVINLMASLAEFDIEMKKEAQMAGIAARKEGKGYVSARKGVTETHEQFLEKPLTKKILRHLQKNNARVNKAHREITYKDVKSGKLTRPSTRTITKVKNIAIEAGLLEFKTPEQLKEEKMIAAFGKDMDVTPNLFNS